MRAQNATRDAKPRRRRGRRRGSLFAAMLEVGLWAFSLGALGTAVWMKADEVVYQVRHRDVVTAPREIAGEGAVERAKPVPAGTALGRIAIPRLDLSAVVAEGTTSTVLRRAVGRLASSARPGELGNIVLAGHRDTFFRPLEEIEHGDEIVLETPSGRDVYRVEWTAVVEPSEVGLVADSGYPALTLVTCYPFRYVGDAPQRFVVRARRSETAPEARASAAHASGRFTRAG